MPHSPHPRKPNRGVFLIEEAAAACYYTCHMENDQSLEQLRHSLAHLLAAAVLDLYPGTKNTIGPAIENGFYYDFEFPSPISQDDLPKIEEKMREILKTWKNFSHKEVSAAEAKDFFKDNQYKHELIDEIASKGETITLYTSGTFTDLCRGGHVEDASKIQGNSFKLDKLAGAYWRGSKKNTQLTRIYGLAFRSKDDLQKHLTMMEEAKKRDHRKLGKELRLFALTEEVGPGLPLFYPDGAVLRRNVENYITDLQEKRGYVPIWIPHVTKSQLYEISGHLAKYDALYPPMVLKEEADYYIKPMNCPHFMMLYKTEPHSYRELPMRWTCTTTNYRYEKSGELSGLTRVRSLTQDDCHVFTRPDQIEGEINLMLDMIEEVYSTFGFKDFWVRISTRDPKNPEQYIGDQDVWNNSEASLTSLIKSRGWKHEIGVGEAAFYGPKLDFIFKDVIGRSWQLSTIQLDMNLPNRFDLEYTDSDGTKKKPVVIHRAILGSTERFLGILIEHYGGAFPTWLSPVQVSVVPVSDKHLDYAKSVHEALRSNGIRAELNSSNETLSKKIREGKTRKLPYLLVLGDKEVEAGTATVESRDKGSLGAHSLDSLVDQLKTEIASRA